MKKTVLITGGTGFVGQQLSSILLVQGHRVHVLSRQTHPAREPHFLKQPQTGLWPPSSDYQIFKWNPEEQQLDKAALAGVTDIVHLAGAGIVDKPWSSHYQQKIIHSRVDGLALLLSAVRAEELSIASLICASAIGYYGAVSSETVLHEQSRPLQNDFPAQVCQLCEQAAQTWSTVTRVCILRTGLVLGSYSTAGFTNPPRQTGKVGKAGGLLAKVTTTPFIANLGSGQQWFPWIGLEDLGRIYQYLLFHPTLEGIFNATAPHPVRYGEFAKSLAKILSKPVFSVPEIVLKITLGKRAILLLNGVRISSEKLQQCGFIFNETQLQQTLEKYLRALPR